MTPSKIRETLSSLWTTRWPAFIWGPPGVGKSSVIAQLAKERGQPLVDIRAPLLDPTDLRGIPAVVGDRAEWFPPGFLPRAGDKPGVLFFDELNAASPIVQASLYQLILDRKIGEYQLPDGWTIVAAGNREEDRSVVFRMPDALANRFVHLEFDVSFDDWRIWATGRKLHPMVIGFLTMRRELLFKRGEGRSFPTPRSWEMVADILDAFPSLGAAEEAVSGTVGVGAAIEFASFARDSIALEEIDSIIASPEQAALPKKISSLYILVNHLARRADEAEIRIVCGKLLLRLPIEFGTLLAKDILRSHPMFAKNADFKAFVATNKESFR